MLHGIMAVNKNSSIYRTEKHSVKHYAKIISYPCGISDIIASTDPDFGPAGWELSEDYSRPKVRAKKSDRISSDPAAEDQERSMRRARAKLRRLALANDFRWFVTLTIDPAKVDSHDGAAVVKKLNAWCSNMVQRHGLKYILVPERHKKGGIHFHGFFNDCMTVTDSGHTDRQGHKIFNLPQWSLGFTTAIELYDDYQKAVCYVCKYVGKQGEKPAGRWYYSGGDLADGVVEYAEISPRDLQAEYGDRALLLDLPGKQIAVVNGVVLGQVLSVENSVDNLWESEVIT